MPWRKVLDLFNFPLAQLALTMGAVQVVNLISYRIELLVLNHYRDIDQVGVYSIAVQTAEMLWLIAGSLATAMTAPCLHEPEAAAAALVRRSSIKTLLYTAAAAVVVGVISPFLIPALLGDAFKGASTPLALLLPGVTLYLARSATRSASSSRGCSSSACGTRRARTPRARAQPPPRVRPSASADRRDHVEPRARVDGRVERRALLVDVDVDVLPQRGAGLAEAVAHARPRLVEPADRAVDRVGVDLEVTREPGEERRQRRWEMNVGHG
jgi:hypothetical protein